MRRWLSIMLVALALVACEDDSADLPEPIEMTADAVGHYCQMDLLTHEGPKGQIHLDGLPAPIFFSQVKDTITYLHMPEQSHSVKVAYVQDMAGAESWAQPGDWISVDEAVYVVGSDRMGGMNAPEFVPFSDEAAATAFIARHGGKLRSYDDIDTGDVFDASEPADAEAQTDIARRLRALSSYGSN